MSDPENRTEFEAQVVTSLTTPVSLPYVTNRFRNQFKKLGSGYPLNQSGFRAHKSHSLSVKGISHKPKDNGVFSLTYDPSSLLFTGIEENVV